MCVCMVLFDVDPCLRVVQVYLWILRATVAALIVFLMMEALKPIAVLASLIPPTLRQSRQVHLGFNSPWFTVDVQIFMNFNICVPYVLVFMGINYM